MPRLLHDRALFEALLTHVQTLNVAIREGVIFGYPAIFIDDRVAFCVYGSGIGIRLPAGVAQLMVDRGRAFYFQPYGRSLMREWVEMRVPRDRLDEITHVLSESIRFMRASGDST
ncbi:hypothetical protein [Paraburkholderia sp. J11-2]|uniref:hypothetical protein n=1 Tax=Paraburkholderia sp. J11-2 TaxID=2805431 RepID=UPI002AB6DADA|nr:hypothetical protein [Paraburkholderia sp. J11-2]